MAQFTEEEYFQGLALLSKANPNHPLLKVLNMGPTTFNRSKLSNELQSLNLDLPGHKPLPTQKDPTPSKGQRKQQRGRKKRDFYPKELHPAYDRQNELYKEVNGLHPRLELIWKFDVGQCKDSVKALVKAWDEIDGIYRLLDYWEDNGVVLPNKYQKDYHPEITDRAALMQRRANLRSYVYKHKKKPQKAEKVKQWKREIKLIEAQLALDDPN